MSSVTLLQVSARLRSEVASVKRELDEAHSMWESRVEGLKATLQVRPPPLTSVVPSPGESHAQALSRSRMPRPPNSTPKP